MALARLCHNVLGAWVHTRESIALEIFDSMLAVILKTMHSKINYRCIFRPSGGRFRRRGHITAKHYRTHKKESQHIVKLLTNSVRSGETFWRNPASLNKGKSCGRLLQPGQSQDQHTAVVTHFCAECHLLSMWALQEMEHTLGWFSFEP